MFETECKMRFLTLSGVLALTMLVLPIAAYARGYGGGGGRGGNGGGRDTAYSDRSQVSASAQRSAPSARTESAVSAPRTFSAPRSNNDFTNFRSSERFSNNQQFSAPAMNFNNRQVAAESRAANVQRFNSDFSARQSQVTSNDTRTMRDNFNKRFWTRTESPAAPANQGTMRSETSDRGHTDAGTWRHATPQIINENNRTAITRNEDSHANSVRGTTGAAPLGVTARTEASGWHHGDNRSAIFGRDARAQSAPAWNRENASQRVVNNVPSAAATDRTAFGRGSRDFSRHDGSHRFIDVPRNDFTFFGRHHHFIHHRIITPDFFFVAFFDYGPWYTYCPVYPYYHRGYLFVNPCGYWPYGYDYMRYYWYGCYPYYWYGYNPVPYEYGSDTNNYYTYNYYGTGTTGPAPAPALNNMSNYTPPQPAPATTADQYFDDGVKAFGSSDFKTAVTKFALANQMTTNDKVLPFAYSQAFLATGDYKAAAQVLRAAVGKVNPATEGVFYPRGLYASDDILLKQIDELSAATSQNPQDSDLQVLLGYQYLGLGELDKATEPLQNASMDSMNAPTANALLQLLDKLQATQSQAQTQTPNTAPTEESEQQ